MIGEPQFTYIGKKNGEHQWQVFRCDSSRLVMVTIGIITAKPFPQRYELSTREGVEDYHSLKDVQEQVSWGVKIGLY